MILRGQGCVGFHFFILSDRENGILKSLKYVALKSFSIEMWESSLDPILFKYMGENIRNKYL